MLEKALEAERKRSASLSAKLKKSRADKRRTQSSMDPNVEQLEEIRLHSTMNEDGRSTQNSFSNESSFLTCMNSLTFASLNVPECKPVNEGEDIDRRTFEKWRDMLETSMQLVGVSDEPTKMNAFKIRAGSRLLDIFDSTTSSAESPNAEMYPYSNAIARITHFFGSRDYCLMQRHKLRSITQTNGETDTKFVKRVIDAAKLCSFGEEQMLENVVFVVQSHAVNVKIREASRKVLRKGGSLATLLEKVQACEMEKMNEEIFLKNHKKTVQAEVAAVSYASAGQSSSRPGFRSKNSTHNSSGYLDNLGF